MTALTHEAVVAGSRTGRVNWPGALASRGLAVGRLFFAVAFCTNFLTSLLVVGWTTRWMRRQIWQGWWRSGGVEGDTGLDQLGRSLELDIDGGRPPRWIVADRFGERLAAFGPAGKPASWLRRGARLPALLVGGLAANLLEGLRMLAATLCVTLPGCFLLLAGWKYGWDNSFHKGYEQAFVGRITGAVGILCLVPALMYLPMGWAHLAATGRFRSFFDRRLVKALMRHRLAQVTIWMALLVVLAAPLHLAWIRVYGAVEEFPWLAEASPEQLHGFTESYVFNTAWLVAPFFLALHLLAARIYRAALPDVLQARPDLDHDLPASLRTGLATLGLWPRAQRPRRHPLVATVLATGRRGTHAVLWVALVLLSLTFIAQMFAANFMHYHDFLVWLNPLLVHLPCPRWSI
jgi:hypothetical protein